MPLDDAVGVNCKKGATTENQGAGVKKEKKKKEKMFIQIKRI